MSDELSKNSAMGDGELSDEQLEQAAGGLAEATLPGGGGGKLESMEGLPEVDESKDPTKIPDIEW